MRRRNWSGGKVVIDKSPVYENSRAKLLRQPSIREQIDRGAVSLRGEQNKFCLEERTEEIIDVPSLHRPVTVGPAEGLVDDMTHAETGRFVSEENRTVEVAERMTAHRGIVRSEHPDRCSKASAHCRLDAPAEYFIRKALELLPGGPDEPNGVLRHPLKAAERGARDLHGCRKSLVWQYRCRLIDQAKERGTA